jgi:hypothetical protein
MTWQPGLRWHSQVVRCALVQASPYLVNTLQINGLVSVEDQIQGRGL